MAKQLINPVERHVEKVVLGVAGMVLIAVVARYLVTTPNHLELGGESVSPPTIDRILAQKAASVRDRLRRAKPDVEDPELLYKDWVAELDVYKSANLPLALPGVVPIGPEVPIVDPAEGGVGGAELVTVVPVTKPAVTYGRSTFLVQTPAGDELYLPANWVTVSAVFDVKSQMAEQRREYGMTRREVVFGPPQLQRRVRRDDGTWSDEDWRDLQGWSFPPVKLPPEPVITFEQEDDQPVVPKQVENQVNEFFKAVSRPGVQLALLRPLLPPIINGDAWEFPIVTKYRDVLDQDDQYLHPDQPPSAAPDDRYRGEEAEAGPPVVETLSPAEQIARKFAEIDRLLASARETKSVNDATRAYNIAFEIANDREVSPRDRSRAKEKQREAEQVEADNKRWRVRHGRRVVTAVEREDKPKREPFPIQQFWVHDAKPGSVESGKTYQYRIRPVIYNRLAAQPERFKDPLNAARVFIPGEWSAPVEVSIEPHLRFFITSKDPRKKQVGVEFYRWFEGNWIKSRRVKFRVGEALKDKQVVEVQSWDDPGATERTQVDFEADAVIVDIDFDRTYRERKRGENREGVRFGARSTACCVVLVDSKGRLRERFVQTDKIHPEKRAIKVWTPPRGD